MIQFSYQYKTIPKTKQLIEDAYKEFIRRTRKMKNLQFIQEKNF